MIFVLPNLHSGCFTLFLDAKLQFNILNTNSFTLFILLDDHFIPSSFLIIFRIKMKRKIVFQIIIWTVKYISVLSSGTNLQKIIYPKEVQSSYELRAKFQA